MIDEYHFGEIIINGKDYNFDVEVRWTGEVLKWWRKEGHLIDVEDVKRALSVEPEMIVIGTGEMGVAKVKEETKKEIISKCIELKIAKTGEAVKIFNENEAKRIVGLFHLTC